MMEFFKWKSKIRILRQCHETIDAIFDEQKGSDKKLFCSRFDTFADQLLHPLHDLYSDQFDFSGHIIELVKVLSHSWISRNSTLRKSDLNRLENPDWITSSDMMGGVCYVDLFAGDLAGIEEKIPYFKELGLTYLHLMPLFKAPEPESDGGYAVSSYREVNPSLGTIKQLEKLALTLRKNGISLVLDFINNHTSNEHEWAEKAKSGDVEFQEYYYMFDDRSIPDMFEKNLREIFPEVRRGNYSWHEPPGKWVWTTFHNYQWDLNYRNPAVFVAMVREMLFLANIGVDFLRLDAVPFTWKKAGTVCENLDEAHDIIRALNACARIAAPGLLFKSEAIVHPDDVIKYISPDKCQVSYNPTVMALLWEAMATREVKLLRESLQHRFRIPDGTSWVNYVRSHDDIGWTFSDDDAANVGINGFDHRHFLNQFYSGDFPGSFSKGVKFQYNPTNQDMRVCGTTASLAGLERGLEVDDEAYITDAINRIALLYGLTMSIGGIPLLYLGDELGCLNDYSFKVNPKKKSDNRWVHRPIMDWNQVEQIKKGGLPQSKLFEKIKQLITLRKKISAFGSNSIRLLNTHHPSVLGFEKMDTSQKIIVIANFSEEESTFRIQEQSANTKYTDLISGNKHLDIRYMTVEPYQLLWLE